MLQQLSTLSNAESRSISPENFTGEKGRGGMAEAGTGAACARDLGQGWKISPSVVVAAGTTFEMADIAGPGTIEHDHRPVRIQGHAQTHWARAAHGADLIEMLRPIGEGKQFAHAFTGARHDRRMIWNGGEKALQNRISGWRVRRHG